MNRSRPFAGLALVSLLAVGPAVACASSTPTEYDAPDGSTPTPDAGPGNEASIPPHDDAGDGAPSTDAPSTDAPSGDDASDAGPPIDPTWTGRPPSAPLFVRTPYLSVWSGADSPNGSWPTFWSGPVKAMTGIARIDGAAFLLVGAPTGIGNVGTMTLISRALTPTKTEFVLGAAGVAVTLDFLSPVEPGDLKRQSTPIAYVSAKVASTDGASHAVSLYFDISGEWAHGDSTAQIKWARESVPLASGSLTVQSFTPATPQSLVEINQYPAWGTAFLAANEKGMTFAIGQDSVIRGQAVSKGSLDGLNDTRMPRAINDAWPVIAYAFDMGTSSATPSAPVTLTLGHAREPAVSYLGTPIAPLWKSYWSTWQAMVADAHDDAAGAASRAAAIDQRVVKDALAAGGPSYAAIVSLSLRQAFGGTELVGTPTKPWMVLKEISSDGNMSTVDVLFPASPAFLYANPLLLKLLLDPLLEYAETGGWPKAFAEHDIGSSYPNANGHNDGNEEDMPIEESGDMILMMTAYAQRANPADGKAFATAHYAIAKKWTDYLVPNSADPVNQLCTDDFTGTIQHSANLSLKGILGVGAMAAFATIAGNTTDAASYGATAKTMMNNWVTAAADSTGTHTTLEFDLKTSWSLKYNALYDRILNLNLIPAKVLTDEATWYGSVANQVGVPLDPRHTYTKTDWELWTAAAIDDTAVRTKIINGVYDFATTSKSRVPFSDWYDTISGDQQGGFQARPVVGGHLALLARQGGSIVAP